MRPEAATLYLNFAANEFEMYATKNYPRILRDPHAGDLAMLGAVRFVQTRSVRGQEQALREVFTTRREGKLGKDIDEACLDALMDCTANKTATARFLADVGSRRRALPTTALCGKGLKRLGAPAIAALLDSIPAEEDGVRRRKLALLLGRVSKTKLPEPLRFWSKADSEAIGAALTRWRAVLREKGRLPAEEEAEGPEEMVVPEEAVENGA